MQYKASTSIWTDNLVHRSYTMDWFIIYINNSLGLVLHHLFAIWHGDKRLAAKFGDEFYKFKENTSIIPFIAIIEGRQKFKIREYFKLSQLGILIAIIVLCGPTNI